LIVCEGGDVLVFGKVDGGLQDRQEGYDLTPQRGDRLPDPPFQLAKGRPGRSGRLGRDQVGEGLRLRQVYLLVLESPAGELPGGGGNRPEIARRRACLFHEHGIAMQVDLRHILPGKTSRRGKVNNQPGIDLLPLSVADRASGKSAGRDECRINTGHPQCDRKGVRTGEAQQRYGTQAFGSGGSHDRRPVSSFFSPPLNLVSPGPVVIHGILLEGGGRLGGLPRSFTPYALAAFSASACRFWISCCPMESRLFISQ
jgi:hypothetical protein